LTLTTGEALIRRALMSYPPDSSGGPEGLTSPGDMISCKGEGGSVLVANTSFMNLIITGGIPDAVKSLFFGGV
jgi:hypothetical protein